MKEKFQNFLYLLSAIIISFFIYRFLTIKLLDFIPFVARNRLPMYISVIAIQSIVIYILLKAIIKNELDRSSKIMLFIQYIVILIFLLFGRNIGVKGIELNLLNSIKNWFDDSYSIIVSLANILMFIPMGFFFKNKDKKKSIFIMLLCIFCCESIQYIFSLGFFDIGDIILNLTGFTFGLMFFKSQFIKNKFILYKKNSNI